ncbi:hypothetical protein ANN_09513 [Periplaneta americana]|uniref:Digestive organ expansion factor homolog n=1 Tax=Periplaneta americana TaxID=6978 RepID=A0ABQ8TLI6_PERAM|nr:hypothetical protein ANN_09513 [Periplaneta americana]
MAKTTANRKNLIYLEKSYLCTIVYLFTMSLPEYDSIYVHAMHVTGKMIKKVRQMLAQDRRLTLRSIAEELDISKDKVHTIVCNDLGKSLQEPDQGTTTMRYLRLLIFVFICCRVVKMIMNIVLPDEKANIMNKKRFFEEFTGGEIVMPKKNRRPEDYEEMFTGNTDDTFRIGLTVTKKSLRLYADFYSADIIVASPLGLRVIVGAEGEEGRDFDFLASVELLVMDQADIFLMQNWDHVLHVLDHFHLQPQESHGTNFARVRSWVLNGWTQYYRQTLLFSSVILPEFNALFNKKCHNYAGKICVVNPIMTGSICHVVVQLPQVFHRFDVQSIGESVDARFDIFTKKILPQYKDVLMNHVLIYIPSYFDYVRLRNYFKKEGLNFVQICEYSKEGKIARARDMFFHDEVHFLLYSERFHFFRRPSIKGILHILFYKPPTFPHFYSEMCNLIRVSIVLGTGVLCNYVSVYLSRSSGAWMLSAMIFSKVEHNCTNKVQLRYPPTPHMEENIYLNN